MINEKFVFSRGTARPIRKILPIAKKKERTPSIVEGSHLWAHVADGDAYMSETDSEESDDDNVRAPVGLLSSGPSSPRYDGDLDGDHEASYGNEPGVDLSSDASKLWDSNQGDMRKTDVSEPGYLQEAAATIIMTVMYSARVARYDFYKRVCFSAKRITRWGLACDRQLHRLI